MDGTWVATNWAQRTFGPAWAEIEFGIVEGLQAAHGFAVAAYEASGLPSNDAYGSTLAQQQHVQVLQHLTDIQAVERPMRPRGSRNRLAAINGCVIYPCRLGSDQDSSVA